MASLDDLRGGKVPPPTKVRDLLPAVQVFTGTISFGPPPDPFASMRHRLVDSVEPIGDGRALVGYDDGEVRLVVHTPARRDPSSSGMSAMSTPAETYFVVLTPVDAMKVAAALRLMAKAAKRTCGDVLSGDLAECVQCDRPRHVDGDHTDAWDQTVVHWQHPDEDHE